MIHSEPGEGEPQPVGFSRWHRNTGGGFSSEDLDLPAALDDGALARTSTTSAVALRVDHHIPPEPEDVDLSVGSREQEVAHLDLDGDGLVDGIHLVEGVVSYADGPRPGLLSWLARETGAETAMSYRSSATLTPAGDPDGDQVMANHRDLLAAVWVVDPVTGHEGERRYTYEDPSCEAGECFGFQRTTVSEWRFDPLVHTRLSHVADTITARSFSRTSSRVDSALVAVDPDQAWMFGDSDGTQLEVRASVENTYLVRFSDQPNLNEHWLQRRDFTEWDGDPAESRTWSVEVGYDGHGNVDQVEHVVGPGHRDNVSVFTEWAPSADGTFDVVVWQRTEAWAPTLGAMAVVEEKALGFPQSSLATHTEARAVRDTVLEPGDSLTIEGKYPPCPTCKGKMKKAAQQSGASITYTWDDGSGGTEVYTTGAGCGSGISATCGRKDP